MSSNEPDDMRQYDNDPRSPYYDDGGEEAWTETRYMKLIGMDGLADIECIDFETLGEIVAEFYNTPHCENRSIMVRKIETYVEAMACIQCEKDYEDMKDDNFAEPEPDREPEGL